MTRNFGVHAQKKRVQPRKTLNTATQRKYGSGLPTTMNDLPSMRNGGERQVRSDAGSTIVTAAHHNLVVRLLQQTDRFSLELACGSNCYFGFANLRSCFTI